MHSPKYCLAAAIIAASPLALLATPAAAQNWVSYVSPSGDNNNDCGETAPCETFAIAYGRTAAGGTIHCLDAGDFGYVDIEKSITIDCKTDQGWGQASIDAAGIQVVLRGLGSDGGTDAVSSAYGVFITAAATVVIEDCAMRDSKAADPWGFGIWVLNETGTAEVSIRNCSISGNRKAGIQIAPTGSGSAKVMVSNSNSTNNNVGIRADTTETSGRIDLTVVDTVLDGNTYQGLVLEGGAGQIAALASRMSASNNGTQGIRSINGTASLRIDDSNISGNAMAVETLNGGVIQSFGNNRMMGNTNASAPLPIVSQR